MVTETKVRQKERVQFDFSPEALQKLDQIKEKTDATTRAETVRNALKLYEWFVNEVDPDSILKIFDKDSEHNGEASVKVKVKLIL